MSLPWFQPPSFPLFLAPMARFTDVSYRQLCKEQGADVMVTEFVMSDAIHRGDPKVWDTVDFTEEQRPMGVQLFGSLAESMAGAARKVAERLQPDFIDLNFGCPADRVTCMDAGSSLLRNPAKLAAIVGAVVRAVPETPVTAKIRLGWDRGSIVAPEVARLVEEAGARAITIHGRTKVQGYSGDADWDLIAEIAGERSIPVVCNGNIRTAADVVRIRTETRCAGVMIGRAAQGYPWIFREIKHFLTHGELPPAPSLEERWRTIVDYAHAVSSRPVHLQNGGDLRWMRPKLLSLTKEMPGSRRLRGEIGKLVTLEDLESLAATHLDTAPAEPFLTAEALS